MNKIQEAVKFAENAHSSQKRDDGSSYIEHPKAVMRLVSKVTGDADVIIASILHDVIEDCDVSPERIRMLFGKRVERIVMEVSKNYTHPSEIKSKEAYLIKMADKLCNISDMAKFFSEKREVKAMKSKKKKKPSTFEEDMESSGDPSEWKR